MPVVRPAAWAREIGAYPRAHAPLGTALAVAISAVVGCGTGIGRTFEPGVEHVPGPGHFLIRVLPAIAIDTRRIAFTGNGDRAVLFLSHRGDERFISGLGLPSTLRALVDGRECSGSIEIATDMEYDGTLTIDGETCALRLDLVHRPDAIEHQLEEDGPMAS